MVEKVLWYKAPNTEAWCSYNVYKRVYDELWTKYQDKTILFDYSNEIVTNGEHFWLPVISEELFDIREEMGLVRKGEFGLHLTLGRLTPNDKKWVSPNILINSKR